MTKEETDLIGEAIDFYNLNHFKGEKTKKQLVGLKKRIKALTIPVVVSMLKDKKKKTFWGKYIALRNTPPDCIG